MVGKNFFSVSKSVCRTLSISKSSRALCTSSKSKKSPQSSIAGSGEEPNSEPLSLALSSKYVVLRKYIPMTRKALVKRILDQEKIISAADHERFQEFAGVLDRVIAGTFLGVLGELKALYDPLNPDKETLVVKNYSKEEQNHCESQLLDKLSLLLEKASFYELPKASVEDSLKEHDAGHGVLVSVDSKKYDVLRIWVIGKELEPVEQRPWYERPYHMASNWVFPVEQVERYKRVVVAVRPKKQIKLHLKSFKDIRCPNMEYLLPDGKIRMTQFDRRVLMGTLAIGMTSIVVKLVSFLADYKIDSMYIAVAIAGVVGLRALTLYKNKRNSYLVNLSRVLYFKSIANNRALLTLVVDRAEDETFKGCLLAYAFLQASSTISLSAQLFGGSDDKNLCPGMTAGELSLRINEWMSESFQVTVKFDPTEPIKHLERLEILSKKMEGGRELLQVLPLSDALAKMPTPVPMYKDTTREELDIVHAAFGDGARTDEQHERQQQEIEERKLGWGH